MKAIGIPKSDLYRLYWQGKKTMDDIAELYSCSQATVRNYMLKYSIPIRSKSAAQCLRNQDPEKHVQVRTGEENPNYRHGRYIDDRLSHQLLEREQCANCDAPEQLVIHHMNGNHVDNRLTNLQVLCRSCHTSYHKQLWWDSQ